MADDIKEEHYLTPSTIETIDYALYEWIDKEMDISTNTNKGFQKVPVRWTAGERAWMTKKNSNLRDKDGTAILPLISIERTAVNKDPNKKGSVWGNIPPIFKDEYGGTITVAKRIKQDKTSIFTRAANHRRTGKINIKTEKKPKVVYETLSIPIPVYIEASYKISIRTEYQQQMNEIVQPFFTRPRGNNIVYVKYDGHTYPAFIEGDFSLNNNTAELGSDERTFLTEINIRVLGTLLGDGVNQEKPRISKRESIAEIKLPKESEIIN